MDRLALLAAKQMEIKQHLLEWSKEVGLLRDGELLFFSLNIGKIKDCVFSVSEPPRNKSEWNPGINSGDWEFLSQCNFRNEAIEQALYLLKKQKNKPIKMKEIEDILKVDFPKLIGKNFGLVMRRAIWLATAGGEYRYSFVCLDKKSAVAPADRRYRLEKKLKE